MSDSEHEQRERSWFERFSDLLIREPKDREQLIEVLRDSEDRDILSAEALGMIESVLQVSEMQVREVMVPKSQMVSIELDSPLEKVLPLVIESGHSRFPVIEDEEVIGILLAKDLLRFCFKQDEGNCSIKDILRATVFTPQSKRLDILLREFRANRNHIAIVIDEYGHVAGLVTIEDVLEQIVGNIEDEYDVDEEDDIKKHDDDSYTVKASTAIDDFNEYFNSDLSDEEFDTIGGLILKGFGRLPKRGETIKLANFKFKILHSDNRRVHLVEVRKV